MQSIVIIIQKALKQPFIPFSGALKKRFFVKFAFSGVLFSIKETFYELGSCTYAGMLINSLCK